MGGANKRLPLAEETVKRLQAMGTPAKLHVMTETPHIEVPIWLNASDALLLTSMHEGSPNIVKEALACNRPVVSVDVGDVKERLEGIKGCYIGLPDSEDLARKLTMVAKGPEIVESREKMKKLSIEAVAGRLLRVYESVMKSKAGG